MAGSILGVVVGCVSPEEHGAAGSTGGLASSGASFTPRDPSPDETRGPHPPPPEVAPVPGSDDGSSGTTGAGASSGLQAAASETGSGATGMADSGSETGERDVNPEPPAVGEPRIRYVGRHHVDPEGVVTYGWPGSGFVVRFEGRSIRVRMEDEAGYHTVLVDDEPPATLATEVNERSYALAAWDEPGLHTVEVLRRTEGSFGPTRILEVEVDGALLPPPEPRFRMEVIGDSNTTGYGNEGPDASCPFSRETQNHQQTYAAIAARALQGALTTVAWSGKGVVYNHGDNRDAPLPAFYDFAVPTSEVVWAEAEPADVVLVNLGTNDFDTDDDPPPELFVSAYGELLDRVRGRHPEAWIMLTVAPAIADQQLIEAHLDAIIEARFAAGDARLERIELAVPQEEFGCGHHPSVATHRAMAERLAPLLEARLATEDG